MSQLKPKLDFYDLPILAKSLKLSSIDVIRTSSVDIESHWFRSLGPADLYYWKSKDKIVKQQMSLFNQVIEWNEYEGVKTGYLNDEIGIDSAEVVCFDEEINQAVIQQALDFLSQVESIEEPILHELMRHFRFYNRWAFLRPVRALKKWLQTALKRNG